MHCHNLAHANPQRHAKVFESCQDRISYVNRSHPLQPDECHKLFANITLVVYKSETYQHVLNIVGGNFNGKDREVAKLLP